MEVEASSAVDVFMLYRAFLLLVFLAIRLSAQIAAGGDAVYFFSNLAPRGSDLSAGTRLYRYTAADGLKVEATLHPIGLESVAVLEASADGASVSYFTIRYPFEPCHPIPVLFPCDDTPRFFGQAGQAEKTTAFSRGVSVNRSGRYTVTFDASASPERIDLTTGERMILSGASVAGPRQVVTADGSVLMASFANESSTDLFLTSPSGQRRVATIPYGRGGRNFRSPYQASTAQVSANGATVLWINRDEYSLHAIDVATGSDRLIGPPGGFIYDFLLSDAGDRALWLVEAQKPNDLYVARTDGSSVAKFAGAPEGVSSATFSPSGQIFVVTRSGRLLKVDPNSLDATELIPATPQVSLPVGSLRTAPGSYCRVTGSNLTDDIRIGQTRLRVLSEESGELHVQVPFEAQPVQDYLRVGSGSPLEQVFPASIQPLAPKILSFFDGAIDDQVDYKPVVVHGDYSGLVSEKNPARFGEKLHFYLSGLGPVTPMVETGAPSPANPAATLMNAIRVNTFQEEIPVEFAGLAPGMTGVYLVTIRLPNPMMVDPPRQGADPKLTTALIAMKVGDADPVYAAFSVAIP